MSNSSTNKLYLYESLLKAIDFFTQRFTLEQLAEYAYEFSNEIVTLNHSALFIKEGDEFLLKKTRLYKIKEYKIANTTALEKIPLFHGNIITSNFKTFFNETDIEIFEMKLVIPLIIDSELFGFIVSNGKIINELEEDDIHITNALMRLYNNALENGRHFEALKRSNELLDQKLYNLFITNQSTKVLLSELNIEHLAATATDVFSEVSCSKVTTLGIYDELTGRIKLESYRNVFSFSSYKTEFKLHTNEYKNHKVVLELDKDIEIIKSIFVNWEEFLEIDAEYIVLIGKDKILGFVTLSKSITENAYDSSMFELIESLAASTYIAISNAKMFRIINNQKKQIEKKLQTLISFNKLVKTINHCTTKEELCQLTLKALQLQFGVKDAFISFQTKSPHQYEIINSTKNELKGKKYDVNDLWSETMTGETLTRFSARNIEDYFPEEIFGCIDSNCLVLSPIKIEKRQIVDSESENYPYGYLIVLGVKENLKEEEVLLIDTITKNITPVLYQMHVSENLKENFIENPKTTFLRALNKKIEEKELYKIDFYLYYQKVEQHPFQELDSSPYESLEHYYINGYVFIISYFPLNEEMYQRILFTTIDDVLQYSFDH